MVQAFDVNRLELSGEATPFAERVQRAGNSTTGAAGAFSLSQTGVIAYQTGLGTVQSQLTWFDRAGQKGATVGDPDDYADVALSPDGSRVATSLLDHQRGTRNVWIYDTTRGLGAPFTSDTDEEFAPAWSPTGDRLVYSARRSGSIDIYQRAANGTGAEALLYRDGLGKFQASWSRDGQSLVYVAGGGTIGRSDLWSLHLNTTPKGTAFLQSPAVETQGQFSPDGKWVAYTSGESGRFEVSVTTFPGPGDTVRVSAAGGSWARWNADGRELFYVGADNVLNSAAVTATGSTMVIGKVRPLFTLRPRPAARLDSYAYDVSRNGQRFLVNTLLEETTSRAITEVVNWPATVGAKK